MGRSRIGRNWIKSSFSEAGSCVEVRREGELILVRDSKDVCGPILSFNAHEWRAFVSAARAGEFDV